MLKPSSSLSLASRRRFLATTLLAGFGLNSTTRASAQENFAYPGGVAEIVVPKTSKQPPLITFGTKEVVVLEQLQSWRALVGISLDTLPGNYIVLVKANKNMPARAITFSVRQHHYAITQETVITPRKLAMLTSLDFDNTAPPKLPLKTPIEGIWQDNFGQIAAAGPNLIQQNHVSFSPPAGTQQVVLAPQQGIVSHIVQPDGFGASLCLDHGRGLFSVLHGIQELTVEVGNGVMAGAVLGKIDASKNTSSPAYLAWQCVLNEVNINPLIMTKL